MSHPTKKPTRAAVENAAAGWILRRDAGLTAAEQEEFERWQAEDPGHREAIGRKDRAWAALDRPFQAGQADILLRRLEARTRRRRITAATTVATVALLVAGLLWQARPPATRVEAELQRVTQVPETRRLPDGSVIELRYGTEVAVDFTPAFRRVVLKKGEAHFQVAKNAARPFIVTAGQVEFRAVGTAFAVQLGRGQVELLVTEGRVGVERPGAPRPTPATPDQPRSSPEVIVPAGGRMVVAATPPPGALTFDMMPPAEIEQRLAWRAPKLEFSEVPLAEAVAAMNRQNRVQVVIEDPDLARLPVSGLFRTDNTDAFVRLLVGTFGIQAEQRGETIVLKKAAR